LQREGIIRRSTTHGLCGTAAYKLWTGAKHRAKLKGIEFDIKPEDVVVPKVCPVLGVVLESTGKRSSGPQPQSPTLDRIDSSIGYIKGNIWVISHRANSLKSDATLDELSKLAFAVAKTRHDRDVNSARNALNFGAGSAHEVVYA